MSRYVSSRESQEAPVTDTGGLPSCQPRMQEYDFSCRGETSMPRYFGPVYVSRTNNPISDALQDHQVPRSFYRTSHDEDYGGNHGENYTLGCVSPRDTEDGLAQAVRALTLDGTEGGITTNHNDKLGYRNYSIEGSASRRVHQEKNGAENHARESGISVAAITHRRSFENGKQSNVPRILVGLRTNESKHAHRDDSTGTLGAYQDSHGAQHQDRAGTCTHIDPANRESGQPKRISVDEGTLADLSYRNSYFLGLGTWPSPDVEASADAPSSPAGSFSPSNIDSFSSLCGSSKRGFTQCGQGGTGSTGSRPQARKSSEGSNIFGNSQGQGSGSRNGKRPSGSGDGQDDDGGSGNKKLKDGETPPKTPSQRFACPFQKHDPADVSYDGTKGRYRSCTGVGFPTIARLKEHLYRCHLIPITCGRCQQTFLEQDKMDDHLLEAIRCEYQPKTSSGITPAIEKELRRKTIVQDPVEKWWEIYRLIFPLESLPSSPYYKHDGGRDSSEFAEHNMPHNMHDGSEDFNEYAERNMPEALDVTLNPILDDWDDSPGKRAYLKDAIIKCHRELWETFHMSKEAKAATVCDEMEITGQHEALPEGSLNLSYQCNSVWSMEEFVPQQNPQFAATAYFDPFLTSPFPPMQQPPPAREGLTLIYDRPRTPQRDNSYRSDSGFGTSSVCDQCNNGKPHQCFTPITPTTGMLSESIQAELSSSVYTASGGPVVLYKDHTYSSHLDPFTFQSSWPNEKGASGLSFHNYCGQYLDPQNAQR